MFTRRITFQNHQVQIIDSMLPLTLGLKDLCDIGEATEKIEFFANGILTLTIENKRIMEIKK